MLAQAAESAASSSICKRTIIVVGEGTTQSKVFAKLSKEADSPLPLNYSIIEDATTSTTGAWKLTHQSKESFTSMLNEVILTDESERNSKSKDLENITFVIAIDLLESPLVMAKKLNAYVESVFGNCERPIATTFPPTGATMSVTTSGAKVPQMIIVGCLPTSGSTSTFTGQQTLAYKSYLLRKFCLVNQISLIFLPFWEDGSSAKQRERGELCRKFIINIDDDFDIVEDEDEYLLVKFGADTENVVEGILKEGASCRGRWSCEEEGDKCWADFVESCKEGGEEEEGGEGEEKQDASGNNGADGNDDAFLAVLQQSMESDTKGAAAILTPSPNPKKARGGGGAPKSDEKAVSSFFENLLSKR